MCGKSAMDAIQEGMDKGMPSKEKICIYFEILQLLFHFKILNNLQFQNFGFKIFGIWKF